MRGPRALVPNVSEAVVHHVPHELVDDAVVALPPILASRDELHAPKKRELVAHGGHRQPESMSKISDAKLFVRQSVHQPKPQRIRQRVEDLDSFRDHFNGRKIGTNLLDLLRVDLLGKSGLHS